MTDQPITIGYETESLIVVTKGLAAGDQVITEGNSRLKDGAKIKIVPATPAPAA